MNILVLGNGFDLAHGLPTKYTDFLRFVEVISQIDELGENGEKIDWKDIDLNIKAMIIHKGIENTFPHMKEFKELVNKNLWIEYFLQNPMYQKENWIDFEKEISSVIQSIDDDMSENVLDENVVTLSNSFLNNKLLDDKTELMIEVFDILNDREGNSRRANITHKPQITFKKLINTLDNDLKKLIRALEIYLTEYVKKIQIESKSPDILSLEIDKVINFNYTDTYQRIYGIDNEIEYDYIHGKANINNTLESNNMVLGIDEYLLDDRKNKDIEFIYFKKYFQRIHKQTGCKYKKWIDEIRNDWSKEMLPMKEEIRYLISEGKFKEAEISGGNGLYIFGHSLDVTDKDILRDLILNDNVHTTIYYVNKEVYGQQIANLVKVIEQEELIKRTGGKTKTITFKQQKEMTL